MASEGALHHRRDERVRVRPRQAQLARELAGERRCQRTEQRFTHAREVMVFNSVRRVSFGKSGERGKQAVGIIERGDDDAERLHDLFALRAHVHAGEQQRRRGIYFEKTVVKIGCQRFGVGGNERPGRTHQRDLFGSHGGFELRICDADRRGAAGGSRRTRLFAVSTEHTPRTR